MTDQEAMQEISWVAREAQRIVREDVPRSEVVAYFERKARLLDHIAAGQPEAREMAAEARAEAEHLRAGLEWPRSGQTISGKVL